jgi:peptidoglycan/LPS O-acetylase OafA/YrhL
MEWWQFAVAVFCNSLMLPVPFAYPVAFPLNSPLWSLSGEMLVNILYGALLFRLATPVIGATMLLAASAIGYYAVTHPTLGLLVGASSPEFHIGLIRVLFGFCCGVLIARAGAVRERPGTPLAYVVAGILAVGLLVPADGDDVVVRDLAFAYLLAPFLVLIGSRIEVPARAVTLFRWLGDLSYPLYVVHFPIMLAVCFVGVRLHIPVLGIWAGAIAASTIVAAVVIPQDRRVRAWLSSWLGFGTGKSVVVGS